MKENEPTTWHNWAHTVQARPAAIHFPTSEAEVAALITQAAAAGQRIRPVGAGHSFTALAAPDVGDVMLSLDRLTGIQHIDLNTGNVTVWAGTRLRDLGELMHAAGRSPENLGDIDVQSVAGAISTGTHGTGLGLGSVGTQVVGVRLIDGLGRLHTIGEGDPHLNAARLGLGALGVITSVTLRTRPAYKLRMEARRIRLAEALALAPEYARQYRHCEFFWIPQTDTVQLRLTRETDEQTSGQNWLNRVQEVGLENGALWALSELNARLPQHSHRLAGVMSWGVGESVRVERAHRVFASLRAVRFRETEYAVPAECMADVMRELKALLDTGRHPVIFPVEVRFVRGDDVWLSTAYGRDSAYIAVHAYAGVPEGVRRRYFADVQAIFAAYGGRPHWGKMHDLTAADFSRLYPKFANFVALRAQLDPERRFASEYLTRVLGS